MESKNNEIQISLSEEDMYTIIDKEISSNKDLDASTKKLMEECGVKKIMLELFRSSAKTVTKGIQKADPISSPEIVQQYFRSFLSFYQSQNLQLAERLSKPQKTGQVETGLIREHVQSDLQQIEKDLNEREAMLQCLVSQLNGASLDKEQEHKMQMLAAQRQHQEVLLSCGSKYLQTIKKSDLVELKAFASPPPVVVQVISMAAYLVGDPHKEWSDCKKNSLANPQAFLSKLTSAFQELEVQFKAGNYSNERLDYTTKFIINRSKAAITPEYCAKVSKPICQMSYLFCSYAAFDYGLMTRLEAEIEAYKKLSQSQPSDVNQRILKLNQEIEGLKMSKEKCMSQTKDA